MSELALQLIRENKKTKNPFLDLGKCDLTELPDELFDCKWLKQLNLGLWYYSKYNEIISSINKGHSNRLSGITLQKLKCLSNLRNLYLSYNQINDISFLQDLQSLQTLDLSYNQIIDVSLLQKLKDLQNLDLNNNQINDISFLQDLQSLQALDLSNNQISDVSPLTTLLRKINSPDVSFNKYYYDKINFYNNPLITTPIEVVKQGNGAILNYFAESEKQGQDYLYEAKMLIVGQPYAGKTSLRYKLFDQKAELPLEESTTRGIDIQSL